MKANINNKIALHNNYKATLIDQDGNIKATGYAENAVMNRYWSRMENISTSTTTPFEVAFNKLSIGTGSSEDGEVDPSRTTMYKEIGSKLNSNSSTLEEYYDEEENTIYGTKYLEFTVPATSTYVGSITEVALWGGGNNRIDSLAFFKDSEGNPISIEKTANDILKIEATVYLTAKFAEDIKLWKNSSETLRNRSVSEGMLSKYSGRLNSDNQSSYANLLQGMLALAPMASLSLLNNKVNDSGRTNKPSSFSINISDRYFEQPLTRTLDTEVNVGMMNYLTNNHYYISLPNEDYFPSYMIEDYELEERGDGVKTTFTCPIPEFIENTDVIKVNGVALERGVDYTLAPDNNSKAYPSSFLSHRYTPDKVKYEGRYYDNSYNPPYSSNAGFFDYTIEYPEPVTIDYVRTNTKHTSEYRELYSVDADGQETLLIKTNLTGVVEIEPVTSKKFRLRVNYGISSNPGLPIVFGKKPTHLEFANPPADGAKIELTCEVDRPFKDENFIIDTKFKVTY